MRYGFVYYFIVMLGGLLSATANSGLAQEVTTPLEIRPIPADKVVVALTDAELLQRKYLLIGYSAAIVLASILGGYLPQKIRLTHTRMQILMSFVGGLMLGVALFHLLLHALLDSSRGELTDVMTSMGLGILIMFLLLRAFHFHQHDFSAHSPGAGHPLPGQHHCHEDAAPVLLSVHDHDEAQAHAHDHHAHGHSHHHAHGTTSSESISSESVRLAGAETAVYSQKRYSWLGISLGLGLHSIMDGVALAASLLRQTPGTEATVFVGAATFLVILLHKPLDAISITSVMTATGWSKKSCLLVNISFAMMCPLGACLAWWGIMGTHSHMYVVSQLLAFSAGIFLCIALSDLLPEMQFHAHNQAILTIALVAGLSFAWALMYLNPVH